MHLDLSYDVFGEPAHSKAPVLTAHGLFGSRRNFHTIAKSLASAHRVVTADMRNHGESPHDARMDYPAMAADLAALIDAECAGRACIIGHSMGGKAAMAAALTAPERCAALVVADIAPVSYPGGGGQHLELVRAMRAADLSGASRGSVESQLMNAAPDPVLRAFVMHNLARGEGGEGGGGFRWRPNLAALETGMENLADFPAPPEGAAYEGPALFIRGGKSGYVKDEALGAIKNLFPAARVKTIAGSGHWPHADAPSVFLKLVTDFLAEI